MRKFYKRICLFIFIFCIIVAFVDYLSMREPFRSSLAYLTNSYDLITVNVGPDEIKPYINKVQTADNTTKLIIGDSVCHQMFNELQKYNSDISIVGSNAAITMTGQYILAEEYIKYHPDATDIYLIVLPDSLASTFNTTYGYQYAVMPFVETETLALLDNTTIEHMESVYGKFFMKPSVVNAIDKSGINRKLYLNFLKDHRNSYQPENRFQIAEQYIGKIYDLCASNHINLHLYAGPVSDAKTASVENMREEFKSTILYDYFPDYLENIHYYPDQQFRDSIHFGGDYANQECYNQKIAEMFFGQELGEILKFE